MANEKKGLANIRCKRVIRVDFVVVCLFRFLRYALHNPMVGVWSSNNKKGKERKKERKKGRTRRTGARDKKEKQSSSRKWLA